MWASGNTGAALYWMYGTPSAGLQFGASLAALDDINHDGLPDFLVGEPLGGSNNQGHVILYSGASFSPIHDFDSSSGPLEMNGALGTSVAGGDFNHDGISDVLIGDPFWSTRATVSDSWHYVGSVTGYLGCPAFSENYGSGWAGKNGVPGIAALTSPVPGSTLTAQIDNSLGSTTPAFLFVGIADANQPTGVLPAFVWVPRGLA